VAAQISKFLTNLLPWPVPRGRVSDEEGFVDIDLPLRSLTVESNGEIRADARGRVDGVVVGFGVVLFPKWEEQRKEGDRFSLFWGKGAFERTGPESDRFLEYLSTRYTLQTPGPMLARLTVDVVGLDSDPSKAASVGAHMKFFLHSEVQDRYAEVFVNIDLEESMLEFHEKDHEYRRPLVRALGEA